MEEHKGFKNRNGMLNERIFYYHGQERMASDKILAQGKILQVPNPKVGLPFFIVEYDLNYVSYLEVDKRSFLKFSGETIEGIFFQSRRGEIVFCRIEGKETEEKNSK